MTNNYEPLDTRALNAALGTIWFMWTLLIWVFTIMGVFFIPVWFYFAWLDSPTFVIGAVGMLLVIAYAMRSGSRRPQRSRTCARTRKHAR